MPDRNAPFHSGELAAQKRAGASDIAERAGPFIRDFMPAQHRAFFQAQPFLVVASSDAKGQVWATIVEGEDGFIQSPDPRTLTLSTQVDPSDPLAAGLGAQVDIGVVGIELATRRRNRMTGQTRPTPGGFAIDVRQSFGNCPKYINEREWWREPLIAPVEAVATDQLTQDQIARIAAADTLFIGSGRQGQQGAVSNGFDASHRGGEAGFVRVVGPNRLRIPDYTGNNFFNTIGNLLEDPCIGLLFVDFASGGLLHVTGRASIDWTPAEARDPSILRVIEVEIDAVIDRPAALSLRWSAKPTPASNLIVSDKVVEAEGITSFHLTPANGTAPAPFLGGQHLPIALNIPGQASKLRRTYSLSNTSGEGHYRITVKREPAGLASQFLHDHVQIGDVIEAKPPAGDFVVPKGDGPIILVSAGVGITPMLAMLRQLVTQGDDREIRFVHGTRNGRQYALRDEVDALVAARVNIEKHIFFSAPNPEDKIGLHHDAQGRITAESLLPEGIKPDAQFLLCGPLGFMMDIKSGLEQAGIGSNQIKFETFG
ncbi:pyridoxamine 5'-phosphate oxidase family protein [Marinovum sp. 2_MG-2023]|nr:MULTISPECIES: pyridoxamine 5'-phosphate oxidase family protein [unclassified Marinovum]MDO6729729.1 pyridoxamine 5'-phosphate oxidase family protein [Marinovum sp. 2_MG-2023]MDO6779543.1 pyridoxamine 5'-phosphate oxidase family protein [Marinovum sp. 1_MG-2023]